MSKSLKNKVRDQVYNKAWNMFEDQVGDDWHGVWQVEHEVWNMVVDRVSVHVWLKVLHKVKDHE